MSIKTTQEMGGTARMLSRLSGQKGYVLGMAIILSFIFAIASYGNLMLAISQGDHTRIRRAHPNARYAAEAGVVIARERLILNANDCGPLSGGGDGDWTQQVDSNGDNALTADDLWVQITLSLPCPGASHTITTQVVY